jgi:hypothetical protein
MRVSFICLLLVGLAVADLNKSPKQVQLMAGEEFAFKQALHHKLGVIKQNYTGELKQCSHLLVGTDTCGDKEQDSCHHYGIYRWDEGPAGDERSVYIRCEWARNVCRQKIAMSISDRKAYCWTSDFASASPSSSPSISSTSTPTISISTTPVASESRVLSDAQYCESLAMQGGVNHRPTMFLHKKLDELNVVVGEKFQVDLNEYFCDPEGDQLVFTSRNLPFNFQMMGHSVITGFATKPFHQAITISVDDGQEHSGWSTANGKEFNVWLHATAREDE